MALTQTDGPVITTGGVATGATANGATANLTGYNPDAGPSLFRDGAGLFDLRFPYQYGVDGVNTETLVYGFYPGGCSYVTIDQVPSTAATNSIATSATVTNGTAMTLVSSSGAGITVVTTPLFIPQTGQTISASVAAPALYIDAQPANVTFGQVNTTAVLDPTKALARAVSISCTSTATGGAFLVTGWDLYGYVQTQTVTAVTNTTVNSLKTFKAILSVVPQFTDTTAGHTYTVGHADVYGVPLRADTYGYVDATFNNAPVTSPTFVAADTTSPATASTGDVRGTIVVSSNNTKRLQVQQGISVANNGTVVGLFGVTPA